MLKELTNQNVKYKASQYAESYNPCKLTILSILLVFTHYTLILDKKSVCFCWTSECWGDIILIPKMFRYKSLIHVRRFTNCFFELCCNMRAVWLAGQISISGNAEITLNISRHIIDTIIKGTLD